MWSNFRTSFQCFSSFMLWCSAVFVWCNQCARRHCLTWPPFFDIWYTSVNISRILEPSCRSTLMFHKKHLTKQLLLTNIVLNIYVQTFVSSHEPWNWNCFQWRVNGCCLHCSSVLWAMTVGNGGQSLWGLPDPRWGHPHWRCEQPGIVCCGGLCHIPCWSLHAPLQVSRRHGSIHILSQSFSFTNIMVPNVCLLTDRRSRTSILRTRSTSELSDSNSNQSRYAGKGKYGP